MKSETFQAAKNTLDRLVSYLKPQTSSKIKSAIVALYSAQPQFLSAQQHTCKLYFSGQIALLHLDYDRKLKNYLFRLYHLQKLTLLFQIELYYGFHQNFICHSDNPCLYYFQYIESGLFAFLFKEIEESKQFALKVYQVSPKLQNLQIERQKFIAQELKQKQKASFLGRIKGLFFKQQQPKQKQSNIIKIQKERTVLFDSQGEIVTKNICPEWKQIINNSGLKQAHKSKSTIKSKRLKSSFL